jgi:hypothetical protein
MFDRKKKNLMGPNKEKMLGRENERVVQEVRIEAIFT